jgi:transposase
MLAAGRRGVAMADDDGTGGHRGGAEELGAVAMLSLSLPVEIYLSVEPADMRKAFDGLLALAVDHLGRDPFRGGLFVFLNRRRDRMKLLYWDSDGLAVWAKRLEAGTFEMPKVGAQTRSVSLSPTELTLLLRGIDLGSVRQRKRYRRIA